MPIIKSAKKRVRIAERATIRNAKTKRALKAAIKDFNKSLSADKKKAAETHAKAQSSIAKASKKHVIHKNKLARKQRQLAAAAKAAGVSVVSVPKKTSASTTKSPTKTVAKTTAKKPAQKKSSTK